LTFGESDFVVLLDVAAPLISVDPRALAILLVPVVLVEAVVVRRLTRIRWERVLAAGLLSNVASTLAGYPIGWLAMQAIRMLTGQNYYGRAPFQLPWDAVIGAGWRAQEMGGAAACMVYGVVALLLVPTFCLSVWIETLVSAPLLGRSSSEVRLPIRRANLLSYGLLVLFMMWLGVMAFMDAESKHGERLESAPHRTDSK
jgi:hypothetical protein